MKTSRQFSSRWFRVYDEAVDDPKVQTLPGDLFKFWFNCMCLASKNGGYLPKVADIAWKVRLPEAEVTSMIADLYERGLLDEESDTFSPHNWSQRQYASDSSTARVREMRKRRLAVTCNGDETLHATFHETQGGVSSAVTETVSVTAPEQNRTEQKQNRPATVSVMPSFEADRDACWQYVLKEYPGQINEEWDCQIFVSTVQTFEDIANIRKNLPAWKQSKNWKGGYVHSLENFLRKRMFNTQPKDRDPPAAEIKPTKYFDLSIITGPNPTA